MVGRYSNGLFKGRKSSLIGLGPNNNFGRLEYFGNYLKEIDIWIDIFNLFLHFFLALHLLILDWEFMSQLKQIFLKTPLC